MKLQRLLITNYAYNKGPQVEATFVRTDGGYGESKLDLSLPPKLGSRIVDLCGEEINLAINKAAQDFQDEARKHLTLIEQKPEPEEEEKAEEEDLSW